MSKQTNDHPYPIFKWAGGKTVLIGTLKASGLIPREFNRYYEPFFGAGAMFFYLWKEGLIEKATIADINEDLLNVYTLVKTDCDYLISYSEELNLSPGDNPYYLNRSRFNELKKKEVSHCTRSEKAERAVLMMYLNKAGYSGLYRENKKAGNFNVPCGHYKNPTIIDVNNLYAVSESFKDVSLKHNDFKKTLRYPREGDFIYLDPPYMPCEKISNFRDYHRSGFDNSEQEKLCKCFSKLNDRGCKIMLSNSSCQKLNDMYLPIKNVNIHTVSAPRTINQKNEGRTYVDEFVILNYKL